MKKVDPSEYGLHKRNEIYINSNGETVIVKNRKSRIIMKDGYKIVETAEKIREVDPKAKIVFIATASMCSKTKVFLEKNGILTK